MIWVLCKVFDNFRKLLSCSVLGWKMEIFACKFLIGVFLIVEQVYVIIGGLLIDLLSCNFVRFITIHIMNYINNFFFKVWFRTDDNERIY